MRGRVLRLAIASLAIALGLSSALADDAPVPVTDQAPADDDNIDIVFVHSKTPFYLRIHARRGAKSYRAAWSDHLASLFQSLDTDQSGTLDESEFLQGPWSRYRRGGLTNFRDHSFIDFDVAPRDGLISFDELSQRAERFASLVEFAGALQRSRANDSLFMLLDQNYDEQLDSDEVTDVFAKLRRYDRNDDEIFSRTDLQPELPESPMPDRPSARMRTRKPAPLVIDRKPSESNASLARRLYRHYEALDRRISRREVDLPEQEFRQADANSDDSLSLDEWTTWFEQRSPDLEVVVNLAAESQASPIQVVSRGGAIEPSRPVGIDNVGTLVVRLGHDELTISVRPEPSEHDAQRLADAMSAQRKNQFRSFDRDNNGYLDRNEIGGDAAQDFLAMDRDADGKVFIEELQAYAQQQTELAAHQTHIQIDTRGGTLFEILDSGDQHLSQRELQALPALFAAWDRDGDGRLSLEEIPRRFQLAVRPGEFSGVGTLNFVTGQFLMAPDRESARTGPRWFQRMDRNGDGDLSPREFLGPIEMFRRLDTDGDGLISPQEAAAAQ